MPFEIPTSWQWVSVEDISTSILYGVSESAKENGQYKLLRITDIQNNNVCWDTVPFTNYDKDVSNYLLEKGDILFARTGATVGKSFLIEEQLNLKAIYASYLIRVRTASDICPEYLKYFFESGYYWSQITSSSVGVGQPNVNGTSLGCLNLPLPPFKEQKRIVSTLRDYFKGAENIEKAIHSLNGNISLLKSKVLELAVTGKLVPQNPDDEPAAELLRRINPEAQIVTDNGHYPQLPANWCYCNWFDIADNQLGKTLDKEKNKGVERPYLCSINVKWNDFDTSVLKTFLLSDDEKERYSVKPGDLLICEGGDVGRCAIWQSSEEMYYQNALHRVRFKDEIMASFYLYVLMAYKDNGLIESVCNGVTIKHFTQNSIKKLLFPLPPISEQQRILKRIKEFFSMIESIEQSL